MAFGLSRVEHVAKPVLSAIVHMHRERQPHGFYKAIYKGHEHGVDYGVLPEPGSEYDAIQVWVRLPQDEFNPFADDFEEKLRKKLAKRLPGVSLNLECRDVEFQPLKTRIVVIRQTKA